MAALVKLIDTKGGVHYVAWAHIVDAYCEMHDETLVIYVITAAASLAANDLNQPHRIVLKGPHAEDFRARLEERV
jgi:hypothetical protein